MSPRPPKPPKAPSISVSALITPILTLLLGFLIAKHHSGHLHHVTTPLFQLLPQCPPTNICPFFYRRFKLPSGKYSTPLFDVPRRHLHSNYSALSAISPHTTLVQQWRHPRVVVFDGGFDPLVDIILRKAHATFLPRTVLTDNDTEIIDHNRVSDTAFISPHHDDHPFNQYVDRLIQLVGLPSRQYSEVIEVNRYNQSGVFAIHYDFLSQTALNDKSPFHGCQRIATAVLQLTDSQGGQTVFVRDENFKGHFHDIDPDSPDVLIVPTKKGRLIAWFNLHPDTEEIDKTTWHGSMPVEEGHKIAATFYLRNCSHTDNSRRREQFEALIKNGPSPSARVDEKQSTSQLLDDDDDDDNDQDYFDPKEEREYLKELRRYRAIRDASGNSSEALIKAGYSPDDFQDLDQEVHLMVEDGLEEEEEDDEKEMERLKLYKRIKDEGGTVDHFKDAGFKENEFESFDQAVKILANADKKEEKGDKETDDNRFGDDSNEEDVDAGSTSGTTNRDGERTRAAGDGHAAEDEEFDEEDILEAERELGMDEDSIREFERQLREQGLADGDETDNLEGGGTVREEEEIGMDEESIRAFEKKLLEETLARGGNEDEVVGQCGGDAMDDEEDEGGQCGGDDPDDYFDDDLDLGDGEYDDDDDDDDWGDGDWGNEGGDWDTMDDEIMGEGVREDGKVIPPGSVVEEVRAR